MQVIALPDIVGPYSGPISSSPNPEEARWVLLTSITSGGPTHASAGVNSDLTHGAHLVQNVPVLLPADGADVNARYNLATLNVFVPTGTTLTISYGI